MTESVVPLASIPLYTNDSSRVLTSEERKCLINLPERTTSGNGGNFITVDRHILDIPELSNLKNTLTKCLTVYTEDVLKISNKFEITNSWATRNPTGTFHTSHMHGNSIFSGIYYVDAESGDLDLSFEPVYSKNFKFEYNIKEYNMFNSTCWNLKASPGLVVIFPSYITHRVSINQHLTDRRMIGFNAFVSGQFGSDESVDNLNIRIS
jgi:uncharacterized protein (TIGR02466 family)